MFRMAFLSFIAIVSILSYCSNKNPNGPVQSTVSGEIWHFADLADTNNYFDITLSKFSNGTISPTGGDWYYSFYGNRITGTISGGSVIIFDSAVTISATGVASYPPDSAGHVASSAFTLQMTGIDNSGIMQGAWAISFTDTSWNGWVSPGRFTARLISGSGVIVSKISQTPSIVASWSFDETSDTILVDSSGNGNTGFAHLATRVQGKKGNALSFNGTTDYAYARNSTSFNIYNNQFSIECWVNARQLAPLSGGGQTLVRKERAYCFGIGTGGKIGFQICNLGSPAYAGSWTFSSQSIQAGTWYHIAGVWDGQTMRVYINGVQDTAIPAAITIASGTHDVYLGEFFESNYEKFNGILDEVRIYNYAITAATVLSHYQNP